MNKICSRTVEIFAVHSFSLCACAHALSFHLIKFWGSNISLYYPLQLEFPSTKIHVLPPHSTALGSPRFKDSNSPAFQCSQQQYSIGFKKIYYFGKVYTYESFQNGLSEAGSFWYLVLKIFREIKYKCGMEIQNKYFKYRKFQPNFWFHLLS